MPTTEKVLDPINETEFFGMHANPDVRVPTGFVSKAVNYILHGTVWRMRPGLTKIASTLPAAHANVVHFEELDGTLHTLAFCNADMYEYNWTTHTWTMTDLATAGVTLDASSPIAFVVSRGRLVISDGVNPPAMWDPSVPSWTVLSEAPISEAMTIYYDRIFMYGLPGALGCEFQWSDETSPSTGYTGSNQDWDFAQTDNSRITAMIGMNEQLIIGKLHSMSRLYGAVEDTFQTDAVREGFSETEGCVGWQSVVEDNGDVYYLSPNGPRCLRAGSQRVELDQDSNGNSTLKGIWDTFNPAELGNAIGWVYTEEQHRHVVWLIPKAGETTRYYGLVYAIREGALSLIDFSGTGLDIVSACTTEDTSGNKYVMLGAANGTVYLYTGTTDDAGVDFTARIRSRQYGRTLGIITKRLCEVDLGLNIKSANTVIKTRHFDGDADTFSASEKTATILSAKDNYLYRRQFNHLGSTVGWDFYATAQGGRVDLMSAVTQMTTAANTATRNG